MYQTLLYTILGIAALGSGLIAGVFFAFSAFIMRSLSRIPQEQGITAMQSINSTILGSFFMPAFFGTTGLALSAVILSGLQWGQAASWTAFAGGITYVAGMFGTTLLFNVPLNDLLARTNAESTEAATIWVRYLEEWTFWNHIRTAASVIACGLFIYALSTMRV